jgi:hypothetical protein
MNSFKYIHFKYTLNTHAVFNQILYGNNKNEK